MMFYLRSLLMILSLTGFIISQDEPPNYDPNTGESFADNPKFSYGSFSVGLLNHKVVPSLLSFSLSSRLNKSHEIYFGLGTVIAAHPVSAGWKYYFNQKPKGMYNPETGQPIYNFSTGLYDNQYISISIASLFISDTNLEDGKYIILDRRILSPSLVVGFDKQLSKNTFLNAGINFQFFIEDLYYLSSEDTGEHIHNGIRLAPTIHIYRNMQKNK